MLGLQVGETLIFRTIAGHPQAALDDLATLDIEGDNCIEDVMIIYHTGEFRRGWLRAFFAEDGVADCGSLRFDVPRIRATRADRLDTEEDRGDLQQRSFGAVRE